MLPVGRKPVVQYVVEELTRSEMRRLLFVTGNGKESIENFFFMKSDAFHVPLTSCVGAVVLVCAADGAVCVDGACWACAVAASSVRAAAATTEVRIGKSPRIKRKAAITTSWREPRFRASEAQTA
jgi:hypothetical protein